MHELQVTESILNVVIRHAQQNKVGKIIAIGLDIGELSDLENEWIQRYFDYISKDTVADGAKLKITRIPAEFRCTACAHTFNAGRQDIHGLKCPGCGSENCELVSGREYYIRDMEAI